MDDGGPVRTPFRPLHQQIHSPNAKDRLKDSPMDFSYDSPPRVAPNTAASSSAWLEAGPDEARKRPREAPERTEAFAFGGRGSSTGSSGAFLFHQPLSPTIAGPDVEMSSETTPTKPVAPVAAVKDAKDSSTQAESSSSSRPLASSGALTRVSRSRGAGGLRGAGSSEQRRSHSQTTSRRKARSAPKDDNDDDEWEADDPPKSLRRRMGDTMNIQYVFGGDAVGGNMEKRRGWSWLEPEWCLGMAQFAFNSVLLVGVLWLVYGVVRTLQRDVADKVHEYELEFLAEIEGCSHSYHLNRCGTEGAVPALATACAAWQKCSAKDPAIVGRARVAAETVAEIVNGFVDVVSWKSMLFTLLSLIIVVGATNSTLSFFRLRSRRAPVSSGRPMGTHQPGHPYDLRSGPAGYTNAMGYHPYPGHWHTSPPTTPSTKRMCR